MNKKVRYALFLAALFQTVFLVADLSLPTNLVKKKLEKKPEEKVMPEPEIPEADMSTFLNPDEEIAQRPVIVFEEEPPPPPTPPPSMVATIVAPKERPSPMVLLPTPKPVVVVAKTEPPKPPPGPAPVAPDNAIATALIPGAQMPAYGPGIASSGPGGPAYTPPSQSVGPAVASPSSTVVESAASSTKVASSAPVEKKKPTGLALAKMGTGKKGRGWFEVPKISALDLEENDALPLPDEENWTEEIVVKLEEPEAELVAAVVEPEKKEILAVVEPKVEEKVAEATPEEPKKENFSPELMPEEKKDESDVAKAEVKGPEFPVSLAAPLLSSLPFMKAGNVKEEDVTKEIAQPSGTEGPVEEIVKEEPTVQKRKWVKGSHRRKRIAKKSRRTFVAKAEKPVEVEKAEKVTSVQAPAPVREPAASAAGVMGVIPELAPNPLPGAEVAVVLSHTRFFPAKIHLKEGQPTRLVFTTLNKKPAALVIESLQIQRWLGKDRRDDDKRWERARTEINREVSGSRVTEVMLDPMRGRYPFHDAMTGAEGEIVVE